MHLEAAAPETVEVVVERRLAGAVSGAPDHDAAVKVGDVAGEERGAGSYG